MLSRTYKEFINCNNCKYLSIDVFGKCCKAPQLGYGRDILGKYKIVVRTNDKKFNNRNYKCGWFRMKAKLKILNFIRKMVLFWKI